MARNFEDFQKLLLAITDEKNEELVDLSNQGLTEADIIELSGAIIINQTLKRINLRHNPLTEYSALSLSNALKNNSTLIEINLEGCGLKKYLIERIEERLSHNRRLMTPHQHETTTEGRKMMKSLIEESNQLKRMMRLRDQQLEELRELARRHAEQMRGVVEGSEHYYQGGMPFLGETYSQGLETVYRQSVMPSAPRWEPGETEEEGERIQYPILDIYEKQINDVQDQMQRLTSIDERSRNQIGALVNDAIEEALKSITMKCDEAGIRLKKGRQEKEGVKEGEKEEKEKVKEAEETEETEETTKPEKPEKAKKGKGKQETSSGFHLSQKKEKRLKKLLIKGLLEHKESFPLEREAGYVEMRSNLSQVLESRMFYKPNRPKQLKKGAGFFQDMDIDHVHFDLKKGKVKASELQREFDEAIEKGLTRIAEEERLQFGHGM